MSGFLSERPIRLDKTQLVHIACWASIIFIEVIVGGAVKQRFSSLSYYILFYALNIGIFYLHALFVMPYSRKTGLRGMLIFFVLIAAEFALYVGGAVLASIILQEILNQKKTPFVFNFDYVVVVLYRALFFMAFGTGLYLLNEYLNRREREMARSLELEKLQNQLLTVQKDYLRAQINPHLLFNTLDFIKAVSKTNPEQSDEAIDCLSDIMDYALETSQKDFVRVEREIEQIDYMIRLNSLRSYNRLNLEFRKEINFHSAEIIPIILLTLVENIFKHGNLLDKNNPVLIELLITDRELRFCTTNLMANTPPSKTAHTGLKNIKARLLQSYPDNHSFHFGADDNIFRTELKIYYQ
jgi:two-component system LytT family sensor kinase